MNQVSPMSIVQITDIHLFGSENHKMLGMPTIKSFQAIVDKLHAFGNELDLLLVTGNLSGDGNLQSYDNLQSLLNPLRIPVYWLPGNNDCAIAMDNILNMGMISRRKSFKRGGWNFILLDSCVPGCSHGYLAGKTLDRLNRELTILGDNPTLVALHHPPFAVNSPWLDHSGLQNPQELFAVLDRHPQVKLVLFGHIHQEFQRQRGQVHYLGTPSTGLQFRTQSPTLMIDSKYPGFRLLKLYPNGMWETTVERVPYFQPLELVATVS